MTNPVHAGKPPLLEFRNVTVMNTGTRVLGPLSVTIREGEHIAVLGPNGAGKSSFIRTVTREYYPRAGDPDVAFRLRGQDVWKIADLRPLLGIVSNDLQYSFTRDLTGREVVLSGFFSSIGLWHKEVTPEMEERADEILVFLGVTHLRDRVMTHVSSGEARRLLIGRALVHDPQALVLDEPSNSLDLHALHLLRQTLRKVARSGTVIILVTHSLPDIIPEIDRVILMKEGLFWKDGRKAEVLTDDNIRQLFSVPVRVLEQDGYYYATGY